MGENFESTLLENGAPDFGSFFTMLYMATLGTVWHEMFHWDLLGTCAPWGTRFPMLSLWGFWKNPIEAQFAEKVAR